MATSSLLILFTARSVRILLESFFVFVCCYTVNQSCTMTDLTFPGEAVEFGTVLVYTCSAACWGEGESHREECVIVQADPDLDVLSGKAEKQHRTDSKVS